MFPLIEEAKVRLKVAKREVLLFSALIISAFLVRLYFLQFYRVISSDGVGYATAARAYLQGKGGGLLGVYPPVYPILVGLANTIIPDIELAGRLAAMIMGSLIVIPVYLLGKEFFSRQAGIIAALFAIVWPSLRSWSNEVMTQSTYITLLLMAFYLIWVAFRRQSGILSFMAGIAMALAYLTRAEALIAFAAIFCVVVGYSLVTKLPARRLLILLSAVAAGFLLFFVPYLAVVYKSTGKWQLAGKTGMTLADALSEYLGRPDMKREPGFQGLTFLGILREYPDFIRYNFFKNLGETLRTFLPYFLWPFVVIGLITGGWRKEKVVERLFLLSTFAPLLLIITFFFVGPEYLQPYLPIVFLFAAQGFLITERYLYSFSLRQSGNFIAKMREAVPISLAAAIGISVFMLAKQIPADRDIPYHFTQDGGRYDHKKMGLLLKEHLPPHSKIMSRWGRISFYADMDRLELPQADLPQILEQAKKEGAQFLVVDGMLAGVRPQLGILLQPLFTGPDTVTYIGKENGYVILPGVKLYFLYKNPSSLGVAVYEIVRD